MQGEGPTTYWMHLQARADATLADVDGILRETWLECCGHLSAFEVAGTRYELEPDGEYGPPAPPMGAARLADVLRPRVRLAYEYDLGSTTHLRLQVAGRGPAVMQGRRKVDLLARNDRPVFNCGACGRYAERICSVGCEGDEAMACAGCAAAHRCGPEVMSRVVNSPRTGVCGFPTVWSPVEFRPAKSQRRG
ncbi:MAG TPA: hypothetical protein VGB42_09840 [Candidatus Thermoplasmatota archaeon]